MQRHLITGLALTGLLVGFPVALALTPGAPVEDPDEISEEARAEITELFVKALDEAKKGIIHECTEECSEYGCSDDCPAAHAPRGELQRALAYNPLVLDAISPLAVDVMKKSSTSGEEAQLVFSLLIESRSPNVAKVAEGLYGAGPKHFDADALLSFCELGSQGLVEPLHVAVKKGDGGVRAATYLASKGDKVGQRLLKKAVKVKAVDSDSALDVLIAGMGLRYLGDEKAEHAAQLRVCDAAIDALDTGNLDLARSLAVKIAVCHSAAERSQMSLSWLEKTCAEYEAKAGDHEAFATADRIFEVIEKFTPIG